MAGKRPDGDGLVRKRSDGRWEGRIVIGHKDDGTAIYKSVFAKTQKELMPKLHQMIEEYKDVDLTENSSMTLGEWMEKWVADYAEPTLRQRTIDGYRSMIKNHIRPALGKKPLRFLTQKDVQKFYNALKRKKVNKLGKHHTLADSYIRKIHMLLHEILEAAVASKLISKNPTEGTTIPKNNYAPKRILNEEQLDRFMKAILSEPMWHDFFYTEITTGLRLGEICGLKWSDLDESTGKLQIRRSVSHEPGGGLTFGDTKTEKGMRTILLPKGTLHVLQERQKHAVTEWIFPSLLTPEQPTAPNSAYQRLKVILQNAGLPDIRFHDLRHTFATHALSNGVDAKTLSGILGHTNASFTLDTYTHVTTDMQKNASAVVGDFMEELFGSDLQPWQNGEKQDKEPFVCAKTDDGKAESS